MLSFVKNSGHRPFRCSLCCRKVVSHYQVVENISDEISQQLLPVFFFGIFVEICLSEPSEFVRISDNFFSFPDELVPTNSFLEMCFTDIFPMNSSVEIRLLSFSIFLKISISFFYRICIIYLNTLLHYVNDMDLISTKLLNLKSAY